MRPLTRAQRLCSLPAEHVAAPAHTDALPDAGGPYSVFAGKECARALALMSTEAQDCTGDVSDLSDEQKGVLREWEQKLMGKYPAVGMLQREG